MRRAVFLALILWVVPFASQGGASKSAEAFDTNTAAAVFGSALAFMQPRTLDEESLPQLTFWGLRGLTTLDQTLVPELREEQAVLRQSGKTVFSAAVPDAGSAEAWGNLAASMSEAAAQVSAPVRSAGTQGVLRSFFDELFNHLDPYSRYVPPLAATTDRERRSGEAGLGITLLRTRGGMTIHDVAPGSPADDAGMRPGDQLVSVNGQAVGNTDAATLGNLVKGPEGSTVDIAWRSAGRVRRAKVTRALVPPQTVTAERLDDLVLIHVSGFSASTDDQFAAALDAGFTGHRVRGLVVDLRGNRGGLLRESVSVVDQVLSAGIVVTTAGRNPQSNRVWPAGTGQDFAHGRPIVVLVDGRTASAAEIMAAALADNGRAVVVGSSTLGKGLVQTIGALPDGGELFVTWSRVLAPGGWPIQGLGVMPQVCTSLGEDVLNAQLADLLHGQQDMGSALELHNAARAPLPVAQVVDLRNACPAAEGRDADLDAAGFLLDHPVAYQTALTSPVGAAGVAAAPVAGAQP